MGTKKLIAVAAGLVATALALSACAPPPAPAPAPQPTASGTDAPAPSGPTAVSVMWNQPLYSLNQNTTFGNATANNIIKYMTDSSFGYYDKELNLVPDTSYGTYEKLSDDPLTVTQTLADTAVWSDGVPVTAADMILAFGAISGNFNTVKGKDVQKLQDENGNPIPAGEGDVYFDSTDPGLGLVKELPTIDSDKQITYTYSKPFADWEIRAASSLGGGLPAHIVAKRALGIEDPTAAKQAVVDAFQKNDKAALSKLANVWSIDWNVVEMPSDPDLLVGSGPYRITAYEKDAFLTVTKDENYKGQHVGQVDTITVRYSEDPMAAVQALQNNEVQLISPQSTADILTAVQETPDLTVLTGLEGTFEHVDLTFNNGGPFDPATYGGDEAKANKVRQAFLLTIPRNKILDDIVKPLFAESNVRNSFIVVPGAPNYDTIVAANKMGEVFADVDIDGAKALLAEAGATAPKVRILYGASNVRRQQQFALIKDSAEQAGFEVIDAGSDTWGQKLGDGSYDASLFGWQSTSTALTESDANYRTGGLNNFGGYSNEKVDGLFDELQTAVDPAEQDRILGEIEAQLVADNFGVTIFQFPSVTAFKSNVTGVDPITIAPTIFYGFWNWQVTA
ncbi:MAG: ABC transporter family substrate-binding protein [Propionicimonas sp.]